MSRATGVASAGTVAPLPRCALQSVIRVGPATVQRGKREISPGISWFGQGFCSRPCLRYRLRFRAAASPPSSLLSSPVLSSARPVAPFGAVAQLQRAMRGDPADGQLHAALFRMPPLRQVHNVRSGRFPPKPLKSRRFPCPRQPIQERRPGELRGSGARSSQEGTAVIVRRRRRKGGGGGGGRGASWSHVGPSWAPAGALLSTALLSDESPDQRAPEQGALGQGVPEQTALEQGAPQQSAPEQVCS